MSQKQYCWQRDYATGFAVLHWSEDGGQTWQGYYIPQEGKIYNGLGQMQKMKELKVKGYIMVSHPSLKQEAKPNQPKVIKYVLDSYGEEDPIQTALTKVNQSETDYYGFIASRNSKNQMGEALERASRQEIIERALQELKVSLEGARQEDLIKMALEGYKQRLTNQSTKEIINFTLEMYERNDKVQRLRNAIGIGMR